MLKIFKDRTKFCNYACALLTLALLVLQFSPFWYYANCSNCGRASSLSINRYVWLDPQNTDIVEWFDTKLSDAKSPDQGQWFDGKKGEIVDANAMVYSIVFPTILVLLCGVLGITLTMWKSNNVLASLPSAFAGIFAIVAFATNPLFRLGVSWTVQLGISIAILVITICTIIFRYTKRS